MKAGVREFVYASFCAVYGESVRLAADEEHLVRPLSPHGISKLAAEH
jgi:UDP-glucose 4-epimerase